MRIRYMTNITEQMKAWAGQFGREYTDRNVFSRYWNGQCCADLRLGPGISCLSCNIVYLRRLVRTNRVGDDSIRFGLNLAYPAFHELT